MKAWDGQSRMDIVKRVILLQGQMEAERNPYQALWDVTSRLFLPRSHGMLKPSVPGQQYGAAIFDDTPAKSLKKFSRGFLGFMTNKALPWLKLTSSMQSMMDIDAIKNYYQAAEEQAYYALRKSNFYSASPQLVEHNACFGNASWVPVRDIDNDRVVFRGVPARQAYWSCDYFGNVDMYHQKMELKAKTLLDQFGQDVLPETIKQQAKSGKGAFTKHDVILAWYKNPHFNPDRLDVASKRWVMFFVLVGAKEEDKALLKIDGSDYGPMVWRSQVEFGVDYGTGLAADALTVAMMGNKFGEKIVTAAHLAVEPVIRAHANLRGTIKLNPGAKNYTKNDEFIETLMDRLNVVVSDMERGRMRDDVEDWLFVPFFEMLSQRDLPQMTAYQASQMMGEKAVMMSTISGSFEDDCCDHSIGVLLDHEAKSGRMPEPPEELMTMGDGSLDAQYTGILSQLQRSLFKSKGILEGIAVAGEWAGLFPDSLQKIDGDEGMEEALLAQGFPQKLIRSDEQLAQIREVIAKKQAMVDQAELVATGASAVPNLSQPIQPYSPLSLLMGEQAA